MSNAYWAADAISTSIKAAGDRRRANQAMQTQQAYHCGDIVLLSAALCALEQADPTNPILNPHVQNRIEELGRTQFHRHGWSKACSLVINPKDVLRQLEIQHEEKKSCARREAEAKPVEEKRRGIFVRRTVFHWNGVDYETRDIANAVKAYTLKQIEAAQLGDL